MAELHCVDNVVIIPGNHFHSDHGAQLKEIQNHGLVVNRDYTWCYYPAQVGRWVYHDEDVVWESNSARSEITFADARWAMYFVLKWT
jgi:hypothetical protein